MFLACLAHCLLVYQSISHSTCLLCCLLDLLTHKPTCVFLNCLLACLAHRLLVYLSTCLVCCLLDLLTHNPTYVLPNCLLSCLAHRLLVYLSTCLVCCLLDLLTHNPTRVLPDCRHTDCLLVFLSISHSICLFCYEFMRHVERYATTAIRIELKLFSVILVIFGWGWGVVGFSGSVLLYQLI